MCDISDCGFLTTSSAFLKKSRFRYCLRQNLTDDFFLCFFQRSKNLPTAYSSSYMWERQFFLFSFFLKKTDDFKRNLKHHFFWKADQVVKKRKPKRFSPTLHNNNKTYITSATRGKQASVASNHTSLQRALLIDTDKGEDYYSLNTSAPEFAGLLGVSTTCSGVKW